MILEGQQGLGTQHTHSAASSISWEFHAHFDKSSGTGSKVWLMYKFIHTEILEVE